ncbi:auxin-responsive protein SAUR68-like [Tasmannia lanceolata]|uniref:auxin-responsive protein SAUR68-like n=1 Tax=Tasmannia lanceolata TaxID=3420 RepID=UPI0040648195
MMNTKRIVEMARKWRKVAAIGRRRISLPRTNGTMDSTKRSRPVVEKGQFAAYTVDGRRFALPLAYLKSPIFTELLKMSEEEFGLPGKGPITLPCDVIFMDYTVSLLQSSLSKDVEKALLISMATGRCSTSSLLLHRQDKQQLLVHGF